MLGGMKQAIDARKKDKQADLIEQNQFYVTNNKIMYLGGITGMKLIISLVKTRLLLELTTCNCRSFKTLR